jgi:hypothetical protein
LTSYIYYNDKLKLFYNNNKNYLLYKLIQQWKDIIKSGAFQAGRTQRHPVPPPGAEGGSREINMPSGEKI